MPEAVIVSAARSPIGRAFKGSLKDLRPEFYSAGTIVDAETGEELVKAGAQLGE